MSEIQFPSPADRIIAAHSPKDKFRIDTSLPDLAFLRQLAIQGRLRYFFGTTSGAGTTVSVVPPVGETLFIYKVVIGATIGSVVSHTVTMDGIIRINFGTDPDATNLIELSYFDSLVGNGIKAFTISHGNTATGAAFGWVENTARIRDVAT